MQSTASCVAERARCQVVKKFVQHDAGVRLDGHRLLVHDDALVRNLSHYHVHSLRGVAGAHLLTPPAVADAHALQRGPGAQASADGCRTSRHLRCTLQADSKRAPSRVWPTQQWPGRPQSSAQLGRVSERVCLPGAKAGTQPDAQSICAHLWPAHAHGGRARPLALEVG
jgi:hypothetical protein